MTTWFYFVWRRRRHHDDKICWPRLRSALYLTSSLDFSNSKTTFARLIRQNNWIPQFSNKKKKLRTGNWPRKTSECERWIKTATPLLAIVSETWHITDFSLTSTSSFSHEGAEYDWKLHVVNSPQTDLQQKSNRKSESFPKVMRLQCG